VAELRDLLIDLAIIIVFMVGIGLFRTPKGARNGNIITALAFGAAIALVFARNVIQQPAIVAVAFAIGAAIGWYVSEKITMTRIPALIALQNGAGGGASLLVSTVELTRSGGDLATVNTVFAYVGILVGAVALSGSVLAALKLEGKVNPRPRVLKAHNLVLAAMLVVFAALAIAAAGLSGTSHVAVVLALGLISLVFGVAFSIRIGGADMPVLISFLNTLSGLAAAFVGVAVGNKMLIAAGAMVGSSGLILTWVMCVSMNRTLIGVLTGHSLAKAARGRLREHVQDALHESSDEVEPAPAAADMRDNEGGAEPPAQSAEGFSASASQMSATADDSPMALARAALDAASSVIVVPGYGMAQAHAQFDVARLARTLEEAGKQVRFAVHPVAGRMPGHMHVLLAEAEVDYDKLFEMDDINDDFAATDVVLVVGACDVVNPAANSAEDTPISGMPILRVDEAGTVIVCNLDEKPGYSGVPNPLYDEPKTIMLLGDAKASIEGLLAVEQEDAGACEIPAPAEKSEEAETAGDPLCAARAALDAASSVIVVPGYGMAQAHAQFDVARLARTLEEAGKQVRFAVHPVAGRMPGHMHVLLAEAEVDYDKLFEMDDINDDFAATDVVLVVGACDVVNPAANSAEDTPISGMPILRVDEAGTVIVCNLDEKPGYSGVPNPLYDEPKTIMLLGDAKASIEGLLESV
jgi:NAD(P) transhydrogenase subunit beta